MLNKPNLVTQVLHYLINLLQLPLPLHEHLSGETNTVLGCLLVSLKLQIDLRLLRLGQFLHSGLWFKLFELFLLIHLLLMHGRMHHLMLFLRIKLNTRVE